MTQMVATKAAAQMGAPEAATQAGIGDWEPSSDTGSSDACGGCEAVEDPIGVRELVIPRALAVMPLLMIH